MNPDSVTSSDRLTKETDIIDRYNEDARRAQRLFTLSSGKITVFGKKAGINFSREFLLIELSPDFQHFIALRHDMARRCIFLAIGSFGIGYVIGHQEFSYAQIFTWLSLIPATMFLWAAFRWLRGKEEAEVIRKKDGSVALEIYNDQIGDFGFSEFVRNFKTAIRSASDARGTK